MKKLLILIMTIFLFMNVSNLNAAVLHKNSNNAQNEVYKPFKGMEKPFLGPLPWAKNPKFLGAISKNNTKIKLAVYRATLKNPIGEEGYNIGLATQKLSGYIIEPEKEFSQNNTIGPYTINNGYRSGPTYAGNRLITTIGGGVCKIASILYNVATFSDLNIIMRFNHSMTVPYVPPGQDATVYYGVKDIRFINNTEGPILIWSQKVGNTVYIAFYGQKKPPKVTWHHQLLKRTKYNSIYQYNPKLPEGKKRVLMEGFEGLIVKSWVTVKYEGKKDEVVKAKGISYYQMSPCIIEQGPSKISN